MRWAVLCVFLAGCVPAAESNESPTSVYEEPEEVQTFQEKLSELDRRVDLQSKFNSGVLENNSQNLKFFKQIWDRLKALEEDRHGEVVTNVQNQINDLNEENKALRWDLDDLRLRNRTAEELAEATRVGKDHPETAVEVSKDYPKWRLPYGVKIDDERPPEVIAGAIERAKAGKGVAYMWLSFPRENDRELRLYMPKIDWKPPPASGNLAAPADQDGAQPTPNTAE